MIKNCGLAVSALVLSLSTALLETGSAQADDSSAELGAGGLVLVHSANIRMAAEELRISPKDVSAHFTFANDAKNDVDTIVAFPLPDIDTSRFSEEPLGATSGNPLNFVDFEVTADGTKIPFQTEQRAFYKGRDVTTIVRRSGVPLNIVDARFTRALDGLPPAQIKLLEAADLVDRESGASEHPHWIVRTRFWWWQHFPARRTVTLDEHYHPVTGQSLFGEDELRTDSENGRYWASTYCIDPASRHAIAGMLAHNKSTPENGNYLAAFTTDYVLVTGNNWNGPIGNFRLVLDKLAPANVLSLCWEGALRKTGATTFDSAHANFAPKNDIRLLVLQQAAR